MLTAVGEAGHLVLSAQLAFALKPVVKKPLTRLDNLQRLQRDVLVTLGVVVAVDAPERLVEQTGELRQILRLAGELDEPLMTATARSVHIDGRRRIFQDLSARLATGFVERLLGIVHNNLLTEGVDETLRTSRDNKLVGDLDDDKDEKNKDESDLVMQKTQNEFQNKKTEDKNENINNILNEDKDKNENKNDNIFDELIGNDTNNEKNKKEEDKKEENIKKKEDELKKTKNRLLVSTVDKLDELLLGDEKEESTNMNEDKSNLNQNENITNILSDSKSDIFKTGFSYKKNESKKFEKENNISPDNIENILKKEENKKD